MANTNEAEARARLFAKARYTDHYKNHAYSGSEPLNGAFREYVDAYRDAIIAAQPESALRAATLALIDWQTLIDSGQTVFPFDPQHPDSAGNTYDRIIDAIRAALDGAPYEPSEAEVERAGEAVQAWIDSEGPPSQEVWAFEVARIALRAARG